MKQITNASENIQHSWLSYSAFNKTLRSFSQTTMTESINYIQNYTNKIYSTQLLKDSLDNKKTKQEINSARINSITYKTKETHLYRFYQADRIAPDQAHWIELQDLQTATTSFAPKN